MRFEFKSFRTKIARRIFVLFMLCAIIPVSVLAFVSYYHLRNQLLEQCKVRLRQQCKSVAASLYERLWLLRSDLRVLASAVDSSLRRGEEALPVDTCKELKGMFHAAVLLRDQHPAPLFGSIETYPQITPEERKHIFSGKALLSLQQSPDLPPRIFMFTIIDHEKPDQGMLLAEINPQYIWGAAEGLPPGATAYVLDPKKNMIHASIADLPSHPARYLQETTFARSGYLDWVSGKNTYFGSYWTLFLKPNFLYPEWIILVGESADDVFAPISRFRKAFWLICVLSLGMVFFLSFSLIRKNLGPMEILKDATRKIADGDLGHEVRIDSGDEFESLAASFNEMGAKVRESQGLLVRAAKLSTMGQMSAGIMHEIKQPLTAVSGILQLALLDQPTPESRKRLEAAMTAVDRLNGILARFKSFSRMSEEPMYPLSLKEVADQVTALLEHQLFMGQTRLLVRHEENLPRILGENQPLQQVLSNLLINAADALENKKGERVIEIRTYSREGKVFLDVEDNGCGIPKEIQKKIFDPFFSTKPPEKGTGLGMAIIESILDKHHASIELMSEAGAGAKFTICFPALVSPKTDISAAPNTDSEKEGTICVGKDARPTHG